MQTTRQYRGGTSRCHGTMKTSVMGRESQQISRLGGGERYVLDT